MNRPAVLIFRKRLLPWSETFIAAQGGALERYRPVFVGYRREAGGAAYLEGRDVVVLSEHSLAPPLSKAALKAFGVVTPRWRRALAERGPVLVHAHFGVNALDASAISRTFAVPLVVTYHGMDIAIERESRSDRRERDLVFRRATRVIAVSEFIAGLLRDAGCPPEKVVVHHIGVDTDHFSPPDAPRDEATVLFVGRLVEKKGLVHLLRALPAVRREVPAVRLLVAGDGPLRKEMEDLARELDVDVAFLGVQTPEQVRALMRRATLFCAPMVVAPDGNAEGLGMTIVEAEATGLPVVIFPSGGSVEAVVDGETGFIAPARDEAALATSLVRLLADPDLRARFGRAARRWALDAFDLGRQTRRLEEIYDDARAAGSAPRRPRV